MTENYRTITWENVNVPAKTENEDGTTEDGTNEVSFTVRINAFKEQEKHIINADVKKDDVKENTSTDDKVEKEYVNISIEKTFVDLYNNVDNVKPESVEIGLFANKDNTPMETVTLQGEKWSHTFSNKDKYDENSNEIKYTIKELNVNSKYWDDTYKITVTGKEETQGNSFTPAKEGNEASVKVINKLKYENVTTDIEAQKVWVDNDDTLGLRQNVYFELYKDGKATGIIASTKNDRAKFADQQKYHKDGTKVVYTVKEVDQNGNDSKVAHYNKKEEELTVTNTINPASFTTSVKAVKNWVDEKDTKHPTVTVKLYQNDKEYDSHTFGGTTANNEEYVFENLPKYNLDLEEYTYTIKEVENNDNKNYIKSYSTDETGALVVTNTIKQPTTVDVKGKKTWVDPKGTDHSKIEVKIDLIKNGTKTGDIATLENDKYEFVGLPKYKENEGSTAEKPDYVLDDKGNVVLNVYTVEEEAVEGYSLTKQEGYDFTNTIDQDEVSVTGKKTWIDPDETKHPTIKIYLVRDGERVQNDDESYVSKELKDGEVDYSFTNLEKYAPDGHIYNYTVSEDQVNGYDVPEVSNDNITNRITQVQREIEVAKTWKDPDGTQHPTVKFELYRDYKGDGNDVAIQTKELTSDQSSVKFDKVDTYAPDGHIYKYTVREQKVDNYDETAMVEVGDSNKVSFTNKISQEYKTISGEKKWVDPEGTTHENVTINLYRSDDIEKPYKTETLANGVTTFTFNNLETYDANGKEYTYSLEEVQVEGYVSEITPVENEENKYVVTNTIKQDNTVKVSGTKTWVDVAGAEHNEVTVNLFKNDETEVFRPTTTTTDENGNITFEFTGLPKYKETANSTAEKPEYELDEKGNVILNTYRVEEVPVEGYTAKVTKVSDNKFDITNTINQETLKVSGNKVWVDEAGANHEDITINLYRNGNKETPYKTTQIKSGDDLYYEFAELPKYLEKSTSTPENLQYELDENGNVQVNTYEVTENEVTGYVTEVTPVEGKENEYTITNTRKQRNVVEVSGTKIWVDVAGKSHDEVTVKLFKNDETEAYDTTETTTQNGVTSFKFTGLPKYKEISTSTAEKPEYELDANGNIVLNTYNVKEVEVNGYKTNIVKVSENKYEITNTLEQDNTVRVSGTKVWVDEAGKTHDEVTVKLFKNDETEAYKTTTTTTKNGKTTFEFTG